MILPKTFTKVNIIVILSGSVDSTGIDLVTFAGFKLVLGELTKLCFFAKVYIRTEFFLAVWILDVILGIGQRKSPNSTWLTPALCEWKNKYPHYSQAVMVT